MLCSGLPKVKLVLAILVTGATVLMTTLAGADEAADRGREIAGQWESSVVTVKLVVQQRIVSGGREMNKDESKIDIAGTIIDPSGLVVVSLIASDPSKLIDRMTGGLGGASGVKVEAETTDVKIRMADGKELPAKIVLRDNDLDLAFVRPLEKPAEPMPAVELSAATKLKLLDSVVVINRLGTVASWATAIYLDRIHAVVEKPRTFYVPGGMGAIESELGCPVFTLDGKVAGILVLRVAPRSGGGGLGMMAGGMNNMGMLPVILPSEDILDVAKQAPETAE